jgi:hypothetical protein
MPHACKGKGDKVAMGMGWGHGSHLEFVVQAPAEACTLQYGDSAQAVIGLADPIL